MTIEQTKPKVPRWRRLKFLALPVIGMFLVYIGVYVAIVRAEPSGIFKTDPGPWPMDAVYPIGWVTNPICTNAHDFYSFDSITQPLFYPLNFVDRRIRPHVWLEGHRKPF